MSQRFPCTGLSFAPQAGYGGAKGRQPQQQQQGGRGALPPQLQGLSSTGVEYGQRGQGQGQGGYGGNGGSSSSNAGGWQRHQLGDEDELGEGLQSLGGGGQGGGGNDGGKSNWRADWRNM